jgi:hypothetical protein
MLDVKQAFARRTGSISEHAIFRQLTVRYYSERTSARLAKSACAPYRGPEFKPLRGGGHYQGNLKAAGAFVKVSARGSMSPASHALNLPRRNTSAIQLTVFVKHAS